MRYLSAALALALLAAACTSPSADPQVATPRDAMFGGTPSRNMVESTAKNLATSWSAKKGVDKNIKWLADVGTTSYGGPIVAGGKVFVGTNNKQPRDPKVKGDKGILMCFEAATGKFLWQAVHDKLPNTAENDYPDQGVASAPAVEGDRLWYVSNRCELVCADVNGMADGNQGETDETLKGPSDADFIWRLDMIKEFEVYPCFLANCSPLVVGDLVFVVTGNGVEQENHKVANAKAPSFLAVNKKTGKVVWKDSSPGENILEGQWSNPSYGEVNGKGQVYFPGGDGWLYAFEPDTGKLIWKFDCNPKDSEFKVGGRGTRSYLMATPVFHDNKVFVGTGNNPDDGVNVGHLWCVDATKTGDVSPELTKDKANPNSAVVWHFGGMAPAGSKRDFIFGRTLSTVAILDGLLYVAELDGFLHCLDVKTGKPLWQDDLKAAVWASPLCVDGKVYIGDEQGFCHIYAQGREKKNLGKVEMEEGTKAPPGVAGNVLYFLSDKHLTAVAGS